MIYKLKPTRVFRAYYGGKNIDTINGETNPQDTRFPEDWLASVTEAFNPGRVMKDEGLSITEDKERLCDIISSNKEAIIGKDEKMSLLFKMLDAAERLVIQGHPTREFAKKYFDSDYGKTECWYILNDGGYVYLGFKEGITKEYWKELFDKQDISGMLDCLHKFDVKSGDMIFVDGGVPHAIGAGVFMAELQEPTDLMVIPEKVTPSGITLDERKLHGGLGFEKMFDCFIYDGMSKEEVRKKYFISPKQVGSGRTVLVGETITDKFKLEKMVVTDTQEFIVERYGIILVLTGSGTINGINVHSGNRLFVPEWEKTLECNGNMEFLFCSAV